MSQSLLSSLILLTVTALAALQARVPTEIWTEILGELLYHDLKSCNLVCKQFNSILLTRSFDDVLFRSNMNSSFASPAGPTIIVNPNIAYYAGRDVTVCRNERCANAKGEVIPPTYGMDCTACRCPLLEQPTGQLTSPFEHFVQLQHRSSLQVVPHTIGKGLQDELFTSPPVAALIIYSTLLHGPATKRFGHCIARNRNGVRIKDVLLAMGTANYNAALFPPIGYGTTGGADDLSLVDWNESFCRLTGGWSSTESYGFEIVLRPDSIFRSPGSYYGPTPPIFTPPSRWL